jgi:hypothetical protein
MSASGACFYFTRLTVFEDGEYFPTDATFRERLIATGPRIPQVRRILEAYREIKGVDLFEEIRNPSSSNEDKRMYETGIYAAAAYLLESDLGLIPECLAFYSSGVTPVLIFSGIVSAQGYLRYIYPFNERNRECYDEAGRRLPLAQVQFKGDPADDVEGFLMSIIREQGLEKRVYLKDRRHHHTTMIGGLADDVLHVAQSVRARFPSIARQAPVVRRNIVSAHMPFYDPQPVARLLDGMQFSPPRYPIIGPCGEEIEAGCTDQEVLRNLVVDAAVALLDTGKVVRTAAKYASRTLVVGTTLGAGVLDRAVIGGYPPGEMATDVACAAWEARDRAHRRGQPSAPMC